MRLLALLLIATSLHAQELAFPGAEGHGRFSLGGRGGQTIIVSNLNNSGAGSLRAAIEATGPRKVVFNVGGLIQITGDLIIRNPYISILGQTAPGTGICIKGGMIQTRTHDVVIRGLRLRTGQARNMGRAFQAARGSRNVIVDHCSMSWSEDAMVVTWDTVSNITIQNCIIAEPIKIPGSGYPVALGPGPGQNEEGSRYLTNASLVKNLIAHGVHRNPKVHYHGEVANNVVYNYENIACYASHYALLDFFGNYYKPGPNSRLNISTVMVDLPFPSLRVYVADNRTRELPNGGGDQWAITNAATQYRSMTRVNSSGYEPLPSSEVLTSVIDNAGARPLDAVDIRILNEVIQGTGSIKTADGIYPVYSGNRTMQEYNALVLEYGSVDAWADSYYSEEVQECTIAMRTPTDVQAKRISGYFAFVAEVDCTGGGGIQVQFSLNGVPFFTDTTYPYFWMTDTRRFVDGKHTLTYTVFDDTQPSSVSKTVKFQNFSTE